MNDHRVGKTLHYLLVELKDEFRRWYSLLSIDEIMTNSELIRAVERTEKSIAEALAQTIKLC